ncbi:MAG: restriction endonuclease subunit S [Candidatus Ventricola sp.]
MASFSSVLADVTKQGTKLQTSEYLGNGKYPIIDQGQNAVAGYTDQEDGLFTDVPVIVFGDHTRIVKYVDTPFFLGADGVKVLKGIREDTDSRYLFYAVSSIRIPNTGYNRHFKWLKEANIIIPDLPTQRRIAATLDKVSEGIALCKQMLVDLDELVKSQFVEMFENGDYPLIEAGTVMFNMRNGLSPSTKGTYHEKVLTLTAITQGWFDPEQWKDGAFDIFPPNEKRISSSEFYICRGNGNRTLVGAGVISTEDRADLVFPDTVIAAQVDERRICLPYLYHAWKQPSVRDQIESAARTTNGTYKINQGIISKVRFVLPPIGAQKIFVTIAEQADKSKLAVQQQLAELETLKKSLMQEYFG